MGRRGFFGVLVKHIARRPVKWKRLNHARGMTGGEGWASIAVAPWAQVITVLFCLRAQ